ncbi:hypothetical protein ND748_08590 [Frankia sp. AiPs1]|uniref:hypothetical protein n=1 Tax=Frankia sp. AiPs1 TaxID=573493 RepID=UPI00204401B1|nr:hypothetical protein [Frankia sp. AiPs1]MCM3921720.1 hypothetical protein [Frankia sp. AiPs1]
MTTASDEIESVNTDLTALRATYEDVPLSVTVPMLGMLHDRLVRIGQRRIDPRWRTSLYRTTSRVGALRADGLYNVGQVDLARRLAGHAASMGRLSGDPSAYGNALRTRAGIELYERRPAFAVAYAGQGADDHTPAGIACIAARARGAALAGVESGQVNRLADRALNAAYGLPTELHGAPGDEHPETCSPTEIAYHATVAAATAGDLTRADEYSALCLPDLPPGFRSVVHAHLAIASVPTDLDRSFVEARQALALSPTPFRSLTVPLVSLVGALKPFRRTAPEVDVLADEVDRWRRSRTVQA